MLSTNKGYSFKSIEPISPYRDGLEHLLEELKRIESICCLGVQRLRNSISAEDDDNKASLKFKGLVVTEQEIDGLFRENSDSNLESSRTIIDYIEKSNRQISDRIELTLKHGMYLPLYQLSYLFNLNQFEKDVLLISIAPELDLMYEKLYAYLQDDVTKKMPAVGLVLDLLCQSHIEKIKNRGYFSPQATLFKGELLQFVDVSGESQLPLLSKSLKADNRIIDFLLNNNQSDHRIEPFTTIINPKANWSEIILPEDLKERLINLTNRHLKKDIDFHGKLIYYFHGRSGTGKKLLAQVICNQMKIPLLIIDIEKMIHGGIDFERMIQIAFREALLLPSAIYLENFDILSKEDKKGEYYKGIIANAIVEFSFLTFISAEKLNLPIEGLKNHTLINVELPIPTYNERKKLWEISLNGNYHSSDDIDIESLTNKFCLTGGKIKDAVNYAYNLAILNQPEKALMTMDDLYKACRAQSNQMLNTLATKITPKYRWDDIVLPEDNSEQLKEICGHVKYHHLVYNNWGFDRKLSLGKGLNILFSGPSGTGKTMAAEIIANELNLDLYKIDLSCVMSKYIGETEKNLAAIFKEAETSNAILFFDEADALFGKRSEVRDSHDRYANIEIAYLLQRIEQYEGIVILATNLNNNIDEAFNRRIHFSIEFPFPDETHRYLIWKNIFPKEAPVDGVEFEFLAKNFKLSGGNVKNIAVQSAFLAAQNSGKINMPHIIYALRREYQKIGKICIQSDFGKYYELVKNV
ncbi:ATP-binding protein [bacterium]|nr:ATP-binding protein [bacterium]